MVTATTSRPPEAAVIDDVPKPPQGRIVGIDVARGLALIGMFTVHVSLFSQQPSGTLPGWAEWWLSAPSGRASVMFMLLAGVSLSVIRRRGKRSATNAAIRKRGLALLTGGLLLSLTVWPASILEHYGMLFLLAPWLLALRSKTLALVAAAGLIGGPVLLLYAPGWAFLQMTGGGVAAWLANTMVGLWLTGIYPLVVWIGFFAVGILVGRLNFTSRRTGLILVAAGLISIAGVAGTVSAFAGTGVEPSSTEFGSEYVGKDIGDGAKVDFETAQSSEIKKIGADAVSMKLYQPKAELDDKTVGSCLAGMGDYWSPGDCIDSHIYGYDSTGAGSGSFDSSLGETSSPRELLGTSPHSGRTAWAFQSLGVALTILGLLLLAPAGLAAALRPLAMLGSISLTAYLVHIVLVEDIFGAHVEGSNVGVLAQFGILVGLQGVLVLIAAVIRRFWTRGPFEWLLKQMAGTCKPEAAG